ncbi:MAG: hypothetical protein L6Q47_12985 [Ignavibacteriaceae bacterium]|nr:hypothetical protein [Ignavibacteriaceae bacterium]
MKKVVKKLTREEAEQEEIRFYKSLTPEERVYMVQDLREQYIRENNLEEEYVIAKKLLRKLYRVTKKPGKF